MTTDNHQPKLTKEYDSLDESRKIFFHNITNEIEDISKKNGVLVSIDKYSLKLGGNNYAFTGRANYIKDSEIKEVRIKISSSVDKSNDMKRELFMLNLISQLGHPTPKIFFSERINTNNYFYIQELVSGQNVRDIKTDKSLIYGQILDFFVDLHSSHTMDGYGKIDNIDGVWKGKNDSWVDALEQKMKSSLRRIYSNDIISDTDVEDRLLNILNKNSEHLSRFKNNILLHGDAGLINFMADTKGLTAILDPEFAIIGDPAYEFSDKIGAQNDYPLDFLKKYINRMTKKGIDVGSKSFLERGIIYSPFIVIDIIPNLWEAGNISGANYFASILQEEIRKASEVKII